VDSQRPFVSSVDDEESVALSQFSPPRDKRAKYDFNTIMAAALDTEASPVRSKLSGIEKELLSYKEEPRNRDPKFDSLKFWYTNQAKYPLLSNLAKKYLSAVPTT